jgi:hypothetical protein
LFGFLLLLLLLETWLYCVAQAGLKLLILLSAGIIGLHHHTWLWLYF